MDLLNNLLSFGIIGFFILWVYSGFKKQTMKETWEELKEAFSGGKQDE